MKKALDLRPYELGLTYDFGSAFGENWEVVYDLLAEIRRLRRQRAALVRTGNIVAGYAVRSQNEWYDVCDKILTPDRALAAEKRRARKKAAVK